MKNTHKLYTDVIAKSGSKNEPLEVTENGTYEAPKGTGYSPVKVNVKLEGNPFQYVIDNNGGDGVPSCKNLFYYYKGSSLDSVLSTIDTSEVTNMSYMFYYCISLTSIPKLDTSKVTNMSNMFDYCKKLTTIPKLDTSKVTYMDYMFEECNNITSIPLLDTSKVTSMSGMFYRCGSLTSIPLLDTSKVTNMQNMFYRCGSLTSIPLLDTSKVANMQSMFSFCSSLTSIPALDISNVTNMEYMFFNCNRLTEIHMTGMKVNFDISASTLFTRNALLEILNNLATVTSTQKLTMGSTNLAKLTDEDKSIATNKGWTLA